MPKIDVSILRRVSGVGTATIGALRMAGYRTLEDLEGVTEQDLVAVDHIASATAEKILEFLASPAAEDPVQAYQHSEVRKNIPPAGLAAHGQVARESPQRYHYDPHLPPVLRFDETGEEDRLPELLTKAKREPLTDDEARLLAEALRDHQPWLEWAGKREKRWFDVDPVALHIHERASAQAIIKLAERKPLQPSLFADPQLEYRKAVQFYEHDVDWTNRMILGDSLTVMHSLIRREDLAGKVQMIYVDPPYGIKFRSNFQPFVKKRSVKDRDADLTREPEQVKAYRDTWKLGVHSYLAYLRDRLMVAKDLLTDSGSIFVQISDENVHRVRMLLDEVFKPGNFVAQIYFKTTTGRQELHLDRVGNYLLWYAKNWDDLESNNLFVEKQQDSEISAGDLQSQGIRSTGSYPVDFAGKTYTPLQGNHWKVTEEGMQRLISAERVLPLTTVLRYKRFSSDFPVQNLTDIWTDTSGGAGTNKVYVVQTASKIVERCMLMATKPGDLVLDPTCGSGTTAYVAEKWGRRWITIDTSRVAIALARQRLLTADFEYYKLNDKSQGIASGLAYKKVPHITLGGIANNTALDSIFMRWDPVLDEKLETLNAVLQDVSYEKRAQLKTKLQVKVRTEGKRAVTEAEERRWKLPKDRWEHWEVPFDADPEWPAPLKKALEAYRDAWRAKMDEVNATIAASAPQETLYDQPKVVPNVLRVSGPFTVEGVQPDEELLDLESPVGGAPETLETFPTEEEATNAAAYLETMIKLLRKDGIRFPDNKHVDFIELEVLPHGILHAQGKWEMGDETHRVAVSVGPQYGPITAVQVEESLRSAARGGYDDLVFAGFTFDGAAQAAIQEDPHPYVRCHLAHIRPDVQMGDLLKDTPGSQLFTVFGLPRVELETTDDGEYVVTMQGVDIYDPVKNTLQETKASKVAAWFLDSDYNGRTFCITQAFFPDSSAWKKLAKALKSTVDPARFAAFSGTTSLPFEAGEHQRIAVKVIDPRGNEVMRVMRL
jgi:adenine-specific DNA-methyltransferase